MNYLSVLLAVSICALPVALSLKCYQCIAKPFDPVKPEMCEKPSTEIMCPGIYDSCFTLTMEMMIGNVVLKYKTMNCGLISTCPAMEQTICEQATNQSGPALKVCKIECCKGDLCNAGTKPKTLSTTSPSGTQVVLPSSQAAPSCKGDVCKAGIKPKTLSTVSLSGTQVVLPSSQAIPSLNTTQKTVMSTTSAGVTHCTHFPTIFAVLVLHVTFATFEKILKFTE